MKILYRCPNCDSVIERTTEMDEMTRSVIHKSYYTCGACNQFISAEDVLSGQYDIQEPDDTSSQRSQLDIPTLMDVLAMLKSEHNDGYVYRGQTKEWPSPLLPSIYRGMVGDKIYHGWSPNARLREVGNVFHELYETPLTQYNKKKQAQIDTAQYLHQMFGYPLSLLLSQQCGITSEGLDVTADPDIAAFFASFDFTANRFIDSIGTGVIYRFRVELQTQSLEEFKTYDFYNCPLYLSPNLLKFFNMCLTPEESLKNFSEYLRTYVRKGYGTLAPERPLELLKFPFAALGRSRFVQQRAGLLVPDMILSRFYRHSRKKKPAPRGKASKESQNAIEDIATRNGVDKFIFRHSQNSKKYIKEYAQRLFPPNDVFKDMLRAFLVSAIGEIIFITEETIVFNPHTDILLK